MSKQRKGTQRVSSPKRRLEVSEAERLRRQRQSERDKSRYFDNREAAAYLRVSESFLNKTRHFGTGPRFYRIGRTIRYAVEDLDDWMSERSATSTREYQE